MGIAPNPGYEVRRRRRKVVARLTLAELAMAVPAIRRRTFRFASNDTLCRCVRVNWEWFDDAVAVLYNTMEVRVALGMGSKLVRPYTTWLRQQSPRFMEYNSVVRQVTQIIPCRGTGESAEILDVAAASSWPGGLPFLPTDTVTIAAAAEAAPLLFPAVHSVVSDIPPGLTWGRADMRRGGDRSFLSFSDESGFEDDTLYIERCVGLVPEDQKVDQKVFHIPTLPDFDVELVYTIVAYGGNGKDQPVPSFESLIPVSRFAGQTVKTLIVQGIDIHARSIIKLSDEMIRVLWPFGHGHRIDCDRVIGLGLKEFLALASTVGGSDLVILRLNTTSLPTSGAYLCPADIYPIRDIVRTRLPSLEELSISLVIDEASEMDYTDDLLPDLPPGPLRRLVVRLWSKSRPSSSKAASQILSFPFNLIRRLATLVVEGGSIIMHGQDLPGQTADHLGMDLSAVVSWIRARPPYVRRQLSIMDYASLGVTCTNDLSRLCFDYGTTMTLPHSLAYFFTSDLLGQIDRHLRDPALAPRHPTKTPATTTSLIASRAAAFDLNNQVMDAHWRGVKSEKDTLAARAAKILWDCKNAGMADAPTLMTTKYPTFFDGLRKAAQTATAGKAR